MMISYRISLVYRRARWIWRHALLLDLQHDAERAAAEFERSCKDAQASHARTRQHMAAGEMEQMLDLLAEDLTRPDPDPPP